LRMLAIANALEGMSRAEAARLAGMEVRLAGTGEIPLLIQSGEQVHSEHQSCHVFSRVAGFSEQR
jgi:hypothetical protein